MAAARSARKTYDGGDLNGYPIKVRLQDTSSGEGTAPKSGSDQASKGGGKSGSEIAKGGGNKSSKGGGKSATCSGAKETEKINNGAGTGKWMKKK